MQRSAASISEALPPAALHAEGKQPAHCLLVHTCQPVNLTRCNCLLLSPHRQEGRSRVVSKATLLASLEPLLAWSFADHTIPPAFRTQAEQVHLLFVCGLAR